MSKVVKAVAGPVLGLITGGVKGMVRGIGVAVSAFVGGPVAAIFAIATVLLTPRAKQQQRQASVTSLNLGEMPRQAIFGQAMTGGSLKDAFNYGGKYGTDWEVLVIAIADHECAALVGFYVNDKYVTFAGDGTVAGYNSQLAVYWRSGTEAQTVPSIVTTNGPGWTANDNSAGCATVYVAYKADAADAKNPVWPGGRPSFAWVVKGAKCYIARKDSTVPGGSGAHRRDNPATWEWTENPIDCRYAWVRGIYACNRVTQPDMLLIGRGLSAAEAPPENTFAPANLCDEMVAGEPRYRIGGVISADEDFLSTEEMFAAALGGSIIQPAGSVEIEPGQAKSPVAYITDDDLLVGSTVDYSEFLSEADDEWANTIIPRYVEPTQRWADHAAPIRRADADVIADGGPRESTLSLALVTRATQAGRVGEIARRLGRLWRRGGITLGPRFCELEEGDWIVWTSQRYLKGASVSFQITAYDLDEKWHNTLRLREINATVYSAGDFIADSSVALGQDAPPAIGAPGAGAWSVAAVQLTNGSRSVPALAITGSVDDAYAQAIRFEYWRDDGVTAPSAVTSWAGATMTAPSVTRREITTIAPNATYYVAVSYAVNGVPGDRRILGPVTAGDFAGIDAKLLTIISDRQTIAYDAGGAASPSTQTTTFTANKQNSTATVSWSVTDAAGVPRTPVTTYLSAATGNAVTMTESQFAAARNGTSGVIVTGTMTDGSTFTDKISVVRVQAGAPGAPGSPGAAGAAGRDAIVYYQEGTPTGMMAGDTWYKPSTKAWQRYDGSNWQALLGAIASFDALNASYIVAGTIVASRFLLDSGVDLAAVVPGALNAAVTATLGSAVNMPITLNSPNTGGPNGDGTYVIVTSPALTVSNSGDAIFVNLAVTVTAGTARGRIDLERSTDGSTWTTVQEISSTSSSAVTATTFNLSIEDLNHSAGSLYFRIRAFQNAAQSLGDGTAGTNFTISAATLTIRRFFVK